MAKRSGLSIKLLLTTGRVRQQVDRFVDAIGVRKTGPLMRPVYEAVGKRMLAYWRRRFYTPSLRSWPPLAESTRAAKRRKGTLGKGILRDDDDLFVSLKPGAPGNILRVVRDGVEAGSSDPKLKYHQRGTARMPKREVLVAPDKQTTQEIAAVARDGVRRVAVAVFKK